MKDVKRGHTRYLSNPRSNTNNQFFFKRRYDEELL